MFKRIIYEDWTSLVPIVSFWFTFGVFLLITLRAISMKKSKLEHLENLPLDDEPTRPAKNKKS